MIPNSTLYLQAASVCAAQRSWGRKGGSNTKIGVPGRADSALGHKESLRAGCEGPRRMPRGHEEVGDTVRRVQRDSEVPWVAQRGKRLLGCGGGL